MKKAVRAILSMILLSSLICFTGCLADAVPDTGSGFVNKPSGSDDTSGAGNWMLCKNSAYDIFDMQVWGDGAGTFDYENKADCGRFTIKSVGGGWIGGGLIAADSTKNFDFSNVKNMTFEIRGNIAANALCLAVQGNGGVSDVLYPMKFSLPTAAKLSEIKENEWQKVTMDVSTAAIDKIINAFCIIGAGDWGSKIKAGDYFEIKNLDWVDAEGKSVKLTLK